MVSKILMVCLGNICRSPLAEGILQSKVDSKKVVIDSAGTGGYHIGNLPDSRSIKVAQNHGINITQQRCRKFTIDDFENFNIIYVMDHNNYEAIMALTSNASEIAKVRLLLDEVELNVNEVPDPYYGGENGFEHVFHLIDTACDIIAKKLKHNELI
ncbi:MAG: low molecular weight protein-tyrosine-phosphatase [Flavobacteriaceae bacterium]